MDNVTKDEEKKESIQIKVDNKVISTEQFQELKSKSDIRLHQESETSFRTLHRMQE
jgi:hypothetical protein